MLEITLSVALLWCLVLLGIVSRAYVRMRDERNVLRASIDDLARQFSAPSGPSSDPDAGDVDLRNVMNLDAYRLEPRTDRAAS